MKKYNSILWGIVLVAIGVIFGLNVLGITDINLFFDGWWTLFIIIPCLIGVFTSREKLGNLIGFGIGIVLLLSCQDLFSFRVVWKLLLPAVIVLIGLRLIFREFFSATANKVREKIVEKNGELKEYCATFSGRNVDFNNEVFEGAALTAVFGGIKCDLRGAVITGDTVITLCCVFGGVDILLPDNVNVKISADSIFGGISDKTYHKNIENAPTVYINGNCIFGGADIK